MARISIVVLALLLIPLMAAQSYPFSVLFLSFKDISTDKTVTGIPVSLQFKNLDLDTKSSITRIIDRNGVSRFELRSGNWELEAILDDQNTPEEDYYTKTLFSIDKDAFVNNLSMYVTPVGSIEGMVIDRANNRINGAALDFKCKSDDHSEYPAETNQFGAFSVEMAPVGKCKISAAYQGKVGIEEVKVVQGENIEVIVNLDNSIISPNANVVYGVAVVLLMLLIGAGWYILRLRQKPQTQPKKAEVETDEEPPTEPEEEPKEEKGDELNPRARDIMATLKDNEDVIVKHLLASQNTSTQAKIRNATGIPKTTLARAFLALEEKKVLKIDKIGKMKKVELTEWFLGKE